MSRRTNFDPDDQRALAALLATAATNGNRSGQPVDGRHARSERSRHAMVEALLAILREGHCHPSSAQIADRAGVTQRTLFNQFGDMDTLVMAAAARQVQRFLELQPDAGDGPLEARVERYAHGVARLLEDTMHVRWAVLTNTDPEWEGTRMVRGALFITRRRLAEAFAPELAALDRETGDEVLDALELETDPVVWRMRRMQQELDTDEAEGVLRRTMLALLRDAAAHGGRAVVGADLGADRGAER
jgi:TetR/AcrR family transcriptional regulator of autoinduction and epiphytic fitness